MFPSVLYSLSPNLSNISHKSITVSVVDHGLTFAVDFLIFIIVSVSLTVVWKFETKASQVQLFCLHVIHSGVVDTLVMHMRCPFNG